jgi:transposase
MNLLEQEKKREIIGNFYNENCSKGKLFTVNHFKNMKIPRRTIYDIIKRLEKNISLKRKVGSGRKAWKVNKKNRKKIVSLVNGKSGNSQRKLGKKFGVSHNHIGRILKKEGVKYYKRQNAPYVSEKQKATQKSRLMKLKKRIMNEAKHNDIVIDDESYFGLTGYDQPGNEGYYTTNKAEVSVDVKYKRKQKYASKILIWLAISPKGHSEVFFAKNKNAMNSETYTNECILSRLMPFLEKHYPNKNYLFWPDLATSHYAKRTIDVYSQNNINYVLKDENPPNTPQLRPIEHFWSSLKNLVYGGNWEAKNIECLKKRIKKKLLEIDKSVFQRMMENVKTKIQQAAKDGADSLLK